jgi:hypothetical protein
MSMYIGTEARKIWGGLKRYYYSLRTKNKSGQAACKPTKWVHFSSMAFIERCATPIESICNLSVSIFNIKKCVTYPQEDFLFTILFGDSRRPPKSIFNTQK